MDHSQVIKNIIPALMSVQSKMSAVTKDTRNDFFKSKYADLAAIWDACKMHMADMGLLVVQNPCGTDAGMVSLETIIFHAESCEWISSTIAMPLTKNDAQGVGSAITYARRYALSAMLGIVTEDDDGNAASGNAPTKKREREMYPDEKLGANLPKWEEMIRNAKTTPPKIIIMLESKFMLTDQQKKRIEALEK